MTPRQKQILALVIKEYTDTAQPVSSKILARKYKLPFSPATLRAELFRLCEMAYLAQPHTSAGRIPTDKGYRFYIKQMMEPQVLSHQDKNIILKNLAKKDKEPGRNIARAISQGARAVGMYFDPGENIFYREGVVDIFQNPELREGDDILNFIEFFETLEDKFLNIFDRLLEQEFDIFIGRQRYIPLLKDLSMLYSSYSLQDHDYIIGAIGPRRIDYARTIAVLNFIKEEIMHRSIL